MMKKVVEQSDRYIGQSGDAGDGVLRLGDSVNTSSCS